ncbi:MAG: hypothetical protein H8E42_03870 [Nitrospinae bacterium]|nr:hypothetical protein [Nitrospinota bacterium]MBL7020833.1 hypothetical protein [Nitrospinaceae bacterium]
MENKIGTNIKRITCFLPKGAGIRLVEMLHNEKNIDSTNVHTGRGLRTVESVKDYGAWTEQDVLTVIVDSERADEIFSFIFFQGELNKPAGGFIYQTSLTKASRYTLPSMED